MRPSAECVELRDHDLPFRWRPAVRVAPALDNDKLVIPCLNHLLLLDTYLNLFGAFGEGFSNTSLAPSRPL